MKITLLFFVIVCVSAACSPYRISQNRDDKTANWPTYRTFTFIDTNRIAPSPRDTYQAAIEQVKRAVAAELTSRGYQQIASEQIGASADLLVNIGAIVREKTQTRETTIYEAPRYTGQRRYHWQSQEVPVGTYKEGTVNVHIVDAQRNNLLWDAAISSVLRRSSVTPDDIQEGVRKLFTKFPGRRI